VNTQRSGGRPLSTNRALLTTTLSLLATVASVHGEPTATQQEPKVGARKTGKAIFNIRTH
jgi:hypothetical protein